MIGFLYAWDSSFSKYFSEQYCQCWATWKASSAHTSLIKSCRQVLECHAKTWYNQPILGILIAYIYSYLSGYIGEFEIIDDHRSGKIVIQLNGRLNKTGIISPRFNVQVNQIESWVNLLLPSRSFGIIILVSVFFLWFPILFTNLLFRPPLPVFWIMRKQGGKVLVVKF